MIQKNYYALLGVSVHASPEQVKQAFRALALRWHPDKNQPAQRLVAQSRFVQIAEAYQILGNQERRRQYDELCGHAGARRRFADEAVRRRMSDWQAKASQSALRMMDLSFENFSQTLEQISRKVSHGFFNLIETLSEKNPYDSEIEMCRDQIRRDPKAADSYYGLGFLNFKKGNFREAVKNFKRALLLNFEDADAFFSLGMARFHMGEKRRAAKCFERVILLRDDDAEAYYRLGILYQERKDWEALRKCVQNLCRLNRPDLVSKLTGKKNFARLARIENHPSKAS